MIKTIFALSTVAGKSAVAVFRLSGPDCLSVLSNLSNLKSNKFVPRKQILSCIKDEDGSILDETLISWFKGPQSFTGEDCAEIHCHGSRAVISAVYSALNSFSCLRVAEPGEFSRRAFLNGKMDLAQAEGLGDLIEARTELQRKYALKQISGSAATKVEEWREKLIKTASLIEAFIDFPDEDLPDDLWKQSVGDIVSLGKEFSLLRDNGVRAKKISTGLQIALVGAANAGKSSLLNRLANEDRAIVSDIPGTTRDAISIELELGGLPVTLVDTAGLRSSTDVIEQMGVKRSVQFIEESDLCLFVRDMSDQSAAKQAYEEYDLSARTPLWTLDNKSDLEKGESGGDFSVSAKTGDGILALISALEDWIVSIYGFEGEDQIVSKQRHIDLMEELVAIIDHAVAQDIPELFAEDLRQVANLLGKLIGKIDVEDLLDRIFGDFCIGK